ncbi:MAG: hypothetical protein M1839_001383 [Geoglossum umbratile]|nr:MAG: hypothetical protein M1839_001383 [Geoglossum umbratile]
MRPPKREYGRKTPHLSPAAHKDDASSLRSVSNQDSDSEDDKVVRRAQTSLEIAEHDRTVLEEEDEREKLLASGGAGDGLRRIFSISNSSKVMVGKGERRKQRREKRKAARRERRRGKRRGGGGEEEELMFEMEEGVMRGGSASDSSEGSSDIDRETLSRSGRRGSRCSRCCKYALLLTATITVLLIFLLGAYQVSRSRKKHGHTPTKVLSNGTSNFHPTTILVSLDGFRADFLNRGLTPTLNLLIAQGISPRYMNPSFPSVTFPNHYTLVTGLYPESHGVVGNTFWDPDLQEEFYYTKPSSLQSKWWSGEPLWVTAEKAGARTAIHMWPGSEAHIGGIEPTFVDKYNGSEILSKKVDRILGLVDLPGPGDSSTPVGDERPQLIAAYVPVVDSDGHKYGPNSTKIRTTISDVDHMLHDLFSRLQARNLTDVVNIVIVSDHGMATTSVDRLIQLDDLIDLDQIEHTDGWPLYGLRPKDPAMLPALYEQLKRPSPMREYFDVYLRDQDMPERYHFSKNKRIAPLWIIPNTGWAIVTKKEFDIAEAKKTGQQYNPKGLHGYDHEHPLMRSIFVARGPAFPHKPNSRVDVFQNIEVYNIICDSLFITPQPNNGTLRLPLKPVGLHSDPDSPLLETPLDPTSNGIDDPEAPTTSPLTPPPQTTPTPLPETEASASPIGIDPPDSDAPRPVVQDENQMGVAEKAKNKLKEFLDHLIGALSNILGGGKQKEGGNGEEDRR